MFLNSETKPEKKEKKKNTPHTWSQQTKVAPQFPDLLCFLAVKKGK